MSNISIPIRFCFYRNFPFSFLNAHHCLWPWKQHTWQSLKTTMHQKMPNKNIQLHQMPCNCCIGVCIFDYHNKLIVINLSEPQTRAVFLFPFFSSITLFTLISNNNYSVIFKLEHFLGPFLKTRSHYGSAHTLRSSLQFLEVSQKRGFKKIFCLAFLNHIWHIWSYRIC